MNIARVAAVSALVILPVAAWAAAGPIEGLIDRVLNCADVRDGNARLACYDGLIPSFREAKAAPPPPVAAPVAPPVVAAAPAAPPADTRAWYDPDRIFGTNPAQQTRPEQFGAESLKPPTPPPPRPGEPAPPPMPQALGSITAVVTEYAFNAFGKVIVFLDNGQVWQQASSDDETVHFLKGGKNVVTISRGLVGSYQLSLNGRAMAMKVKRIK